MSDEEKQKDLLVKVRNLFEEKFGKDWHNARECSIAQEEDHLWNEDEIFVQKKW